jgi:hypothetical protein
MAKAPQAQLLLHDASKTVNDFFLHHIPPPEIRQAYAQIGIHLLTSSTPSTAPLTNTPTNETLEKIHEQLVLIEKSLSATQNTERNLLSYADVARAPPPFPPHAAPEKFA